MCRQNPDNQYSDKTEIKYIDMEEQSPDYTQSEYTTLITLQMTKSKASVKCLKTTAKVHYMHNRDTEHIRPLWVAQSQGSQVSQTDCEVNTGVRLQHPTNPQSSTTIQSGMTKNSRSTPGYKLKHMADSLCIV